MLTRTMTHLIEAGVVPKNVLAQLAFWKLIPEDYEKLIGSRTINLKDSSDEEVNSFIADLTQSITDDIFSIREAEFNPTGRLEDVTFYNDSNNETSISALIDKFGRVVVDLPSDSYRNPDGRGFKSEHYTSVKVGDSVKKIVKVESRNYSESERKTFIFYLEDK